MLPHRKAREITPQHHQTSEELLGLQMGVSPVHAPLPAACQPGLATPPDMLHLGDVQIQTLKHFLLLLLLVCFVFNNCIIIVLSYCRASLNDMAWLYFC